MTRPVVWGRMAEVAVVTDSTAYLPAEKIERTGVSIVPLYIVFGGDRTVPETDITDYDEFFDELRMADSLPTTSQPSVGDFVSVYEPMLATGGEVVSVHISGGLSGTPEAARQAAEVLERDGKGGERIRVIDSTTVAGGLGLVVLAAARAAARKADGEEVARQAEEARQELKMWFAVDTLEFLKRGGRIGAASAWIGSTMKIKPILTVEGEMVPVERVRTSSRMFERMVDYARQRHESGADAWCVQHINAPEQGARLVEACREVFGCEPTLTGEIGPVLSTHVGPGLLGVGSIPTRFFD
jgi:DegV family protein with EDD domain